MAQSSNEASGVVWAFRRPTQPSRFIYNIYRTYIDNKKQVSIKIKKKNTKTSRKLTGSLACGRMRGGGYLSLSRGVLKNKTTHPRLAFEGKGGGQEDDINRRQR